MKNNLTRDLFHGFIRVHILFHAVKEPVYGVELMEELGRHGYKVGPGTIYPMLHTMEQKGLLVSKKSIIKGKTRKYYRITPAGQSALKEAKRQAIELNEEIMEEKE